MKLVIKLRLARVQNLDFVLIENLKDISQLNGDIEDLERCSFSDEIEQVFIFLVDEIQGLVLLSCKTLFDVVIGCEKQRIENFVKSDD